MFPWAYVYEHLISSLLVFFLGGRGYVELWRDRTLLEEGGRWERVLKLYFLFTAYFLSAEVAWPACLLASRPWLSWLRLCLSYHQNCRPDKPFGPPVVCQGCFIAAVRNEQRLISCSWELLNMAAKNQAWVSSRLAHSLNHWAVFQPHVSLLLFFSLDVAIYFSNEVTLTHKETPKV